jgi:RNA polymerase sigma-70 factor (ECF subfamily)
VESAVPNSLQAPHRAPIEGSAGDGRSDAELVAAAMADPRAFGPLYARYLDPVHRYCYRRLGNREAAEDATSLVFMKALAALPRYRDASFRAWLFTIAHHVVTDRYRYRAARPEQPLGAAHDHADTASSPEELALAAAQRSELRVLLARLPEHQRQVVELRLAGLTGVEIGRVLGRSENNVAVTYSRAIGRLRAMLGVAAGSGGSGDGA